MIVAIGFLMFVLGFLIGMLSGFDWQAYFKYKIDVVALGMKYEKEARESK